MQDALHPIQGDLGGKSGIHHVAPAVMYGSGSAPGGRATAWSRAPQVSERRDDLGQLVGVFEVDGEEPVVAGGPAQRSDPSGVPGDPYWHPRLLDRSGKEPNAVDGVVLAAMVHRLTRPRGGEDLHRLVEHLAAQSVIPAASASPAKRATTTGSAKLSKSGNQRAELIGRRRGGRADSVIVTSCAA